MKGQLILADRAEERAGKLDVQGGGWNQVVANTHVNMALGIILGLGRDEVDQPQKVTLGLLKEDGEPVLDASSQPFTIEGSMNIGAKDDASSDEVALFNAVIGIRVPPHKLPVGRYEWELSVEGELLDSAPFNSIEGTP